MNIFKGNIQCMWGKEQSHLVPNPISFSFSATVSFSNTQKLTELNVLCGFSPSLCDTINERQCALGTCW